MFGPLVDALFPRRCAGCGRGPWPFCDRCALELVPLLPPRCIRCGVPTRREVPTCRHCPPAAIDAARSPFLFDGPVRRAIHRLKFSGWRTVADALGAAMAEAWDLEADVVTWVPLSRRRKAARGYDQARALARAVAPRIGLRAEPLLRRRVDVGAQARRGGEDRRRGIEGAFAARGRRPSAVVLLVDDVLTTGATAAACAEALRAAGAEHVVVLTAARAASGAMADLYSPSDPRPGLWLPRGAAPREVDASRGRSDPRKPTLGR